MLCQKYDNAKTTSTVSYYCSKVEEKNSKEKYCVMIITVNYKLYIIIGTNQCIKLSFTFYENNMHMARRMNIEFIKLSGEGVGVKTVDNIRH